ncbi:MAG: cytidylate kinase-like family protein [Dysgonamonadaceae bacterium]|jgi:cytidylate kinase|nr:cytidylate kinase-like family protein [Dysgonamonadaceae bacterium]
MKNYVITIGRQLGSGGKAVGEKLANELGISCYDKELLLLASQESGLCTECFEASDEKNAKSWFGSYFGFRSGFMGFNTGNYLRSETFFKIQSDIILDLAEKSSCIFVGRCADYILRKHPRRLSIFISASDKDRIARLVRNNGISEKEAKAQIEQADRTRASYYNYYSAKVWGMAASYDICFNSSLFDEDEITAYIRDYVKKKFL